MYDAEPATAQDIHVPQIEVDWDRIRRHCAARFGSRTNIECAVDMGLAPRTVTRFRQDPGATTLRVAFRIQAATGLSLDEMFRAASHYEQAA